MTSVRKYGAKGDTQTRSDAQVTASSATVYSPSGAFKSTDVGKLIFCLGAGVAGAALVSTISTFTDPQHVVMATNASTTIASGGTIAWGTNDAPAFQNAVNCAALIGETIEIEGGFNYAISTASAINIPSNVILEGSADATITAFGTITNNPSNAVFLTSPNSGAFSTTLHLANTPGTNTLSTVAAPTVGMWLFVQSSAHPLRSAYYIVKGFTGSGPYTVTVERPVLKQFAAGDTVAQQVNMPCDIEIRGKGLTMTGVCDRLIEMAAGQNCSIEDVVFLPQSGSNTCASLDIGCLHTRVLRCKAIMNGVGGLSAGFTLETCEACELSECEIRNGVAFGVAMFDSDNCTVSSTQVSGCQNGVGTNADGSTLGSYNCRIVNTDVSECSQNGIIIDGGSTFCTIVDCSANNNSNYGILVNSTGSPLGHRVIGCTANGNSVTGMVLAATGTQVTDCEAGNNVSYGLEVTTDCDISGLYSYSPNGAGAIIFAAGSYHARIRGVRLSSLLYGNALNIAAGVDVRLSDSVFMCGTITALSNAGTLSVEGTWIDSATTGISNSGTLRLGVGNDLTSCATQLSNTGTVNVAQSSGLKAITSTGGSTTILLSDVTNNNVLEVSGALASNATLILPSIHGLPLAVANKTTGAFTVTVEPSGGTGSTITQGKRATGYVDGTNVWQWDGQER